MGRGLRKKEATASDRRKVIKEQFCTTNVLASRRSRGADSRRWKGEAQGLYRE